MNKPIVFVSHIAEEADLAMMFKKHIEDDFLDLVDVFVSSDSESISLGADWRIRAETALRQACIQLILAARPRSRDRGSILKLGQFG